MVFFTGLISMWWTVQSISSLAAIAKKRIRYDHANFLVVRPHVILQFYWSRDLKLWNGRAIVQSNSRIKDNKPPRIWTWSNDPLATRALNFDHDDCLVLHLVKSAICFVCAVLTNTTHPTAGVTSTARTLGNIMPGEWKRGNDWRLKMPKLRLTGSQLTRQETIMPVSYTHLTLPTTPYV